MMSIENKKNCCPTDKKICDPIDYSNEINFSGQSNIQDGGNTNKCFFSVTTEKHINTCIMKTMDFTY